MPENGNEAANAGASIGVAGAGGDPDANAGVAASGVYGGGYQGNVAAGSVSSGSNNSGNNNSGNNNSGNNNSGNNNSGNNSIGENIANMFTPNDGASYVNGVLTSDKTGLPISQNQNGSYTDPATGNTYSGIMNNQANDQLGVAPGFGVKDAALGFVAPLSLVPKALSKMMGWLNGVDPAKDKTSQDSVGRTVYSSTTRNGKAISYSHNKLGMMYEVEIDSTGKAVSAMSIAKDNAGRKAGDAGFVASEARTGYDRARDAAEAEGDFEGVKDIDQVEEDTENPDTPISEARIMAEFIKEMLEDSGMKASNNELREIANDPVGFLQKNGSLLAEKIPNLDPETKGVLLDPESLRYRLGESPAVATAIVGDTATTDGVVNADAERFDATTATDQLGTDATTVDAATGSITNENLVDAAQIDMQGVGTGRNADGTVSVTGEALNDFATQNISSLIDTSTVSGKLLAQKLGEGNYTDSKATILGQMEIISAEFKDSQGNPKVPQWAQALSRDVAKTMAFSGISGTAQTAAMANAIMEATLGIAQKEAAFFQTLTTKNLDNRQQAIINKATVMANFETANMDARQAAAIQNARSFLEMDLANLTNEQQAEVVNTQAMIDAIFNDQSAINAARLFGAEQANDMQKYYDNMNAQISLQNSEQINQMRKFNVGEINDGSEFNSRLEQSRQEFYANMQYNLDLANAKWRQTVATTNTQMQFDAAETDVKNTLDLSLESMTRLWDRVDNHLDYIFKGWNAESDRDATILAAELQAQSRQQSSGGGFMSGLFSLGAAYITSMSDERLKENIEYHDTVQGIKYYTWDWNEEGKRVGAEKYPKFGVIAQQVQKKYPNAVSVGEDGYLMVNYGEIQ